jgi:hypothetical protein
VNLIGFLIAFFGLFVIACGFFFSFRKRFIRRQRVPVLPYLSDHYSAVRRENWVKGYQFEKFVVSKFDKSFFSCVNWRGDKSYHDVFPVANSYPDLEFDFSDNTGKVCFAIECKWRDEYEENSVPWATHKQIDQYKAYERESGRKVFIFLGVGGLPGEPEELFIIPLSKIPRHLDILSTQFLQDYKKQNLADNFFLNKHSLRFV